MTGPARLSQSLLATYDRCPRSAWLAVKHKGQARSVEMDRGTAFHRFAERAVLLMIEHDEPSVPADVAKDLMGQVLDESGDLVVPAAEQDRLRVMAYHFAEGFTVDPGTVVAVEKLVTWEPVPGVVVSGKADLVTVEENGVVRITDWKTSMAIPAQDVFEAGFQLPCYSVLAVHGSPDGEPVPLAGHAAFVAVQECYPMYLRDDGTLASRERVLSRLEVEEARETVARVAAKARGRFDAGEIDGFEARPGMACPKCVARRECPVPDVLRGPVEGAEAAARWLVTEPVVKQDWKAIRAHVDLHGPLEIGGVVFELAKEERRSTDWDALEAAVERSVMFGEPFDREAHVKVGASTRLKKRNLPEGEE